MISRLIMISACGLCLGALYFRKREKFYQELFKEIKKCQKYHMDYVEDLVHLPVNHNLILFGPPQSLTESKIINSSFIKSSVSKNNMQTANPKQAQIQPQVQDRLWQMKFKNGFNFKTASNQTILVQPNSSQQNILVFNLPLTHRQLSQQNRGYEQRAIIENIPVCTYGKISVRPTSTGNQYVMAPELIIGNKHQSILAYLDKQIIKIGNKSKILTLLGTSLFIGHAIYFQLYKPKTEIELQIQNFTKAQNK